MRDGPGYPARRRVRLAMWIASTAVLAVPGSASVARAESCGEVHESCLESCRIDHGMERERRRLAACISRCDEQREDCHDVRREERRNLRPPEALPEDRPAPPPDVRPAEDELATGSVAREEPSAAEDTAPRERRRPASDGRPSAAREEPVPADETPAVEKREPRTSDAPPPAAEAPLPEGPAHDDFDRGGDE